MADQRMIILKLITQASMSDKKNGYIALVTVILISIVAGTLLVSIILLGTSSVNTTDLVVESTSARAIHDACANRALDAIRNDPSITGTTNSSLADGTCEYVITDIPEEVGDNGGGNVLSLKFDDPPASTTFLDSSGNNRHFECSGSTCPTADVIGQCDSAASFDGINDFLEDADGEDYINGMTAFSISTWIKSDTINTDRGFLITFPPNGDDDVFGMRYDAGGLYGGGTEVIKAGVTIFNGVSNIVQQMETTSNITTTDWQHLVLTWENGDDIQLFVNGNLVGTTFLGPRVPGVIAGASTLLVGRGAKDVLGTEPWSGLIDNLDIWDRVLTPAEISLLYTQCQLNTQPNKEIRVTSTVGEAVRRIKIKTVQINPEIIIKSWEEVAEF